MAFSGEVHVELDESQSELLTTPLDRSRLVVGAPGTGKTTALMSCVLDRVERGLATDAILVIAPTRSAATAMRDPLTLRLGRTTEGPLVRSLASVAHEIVSQQIGRAVTLLTGAEHDSLLRDLLEGEISDGTDGYWPDFLGPEVRHSAGFRSELREFLLRLTEHRVSPEELEQHAIAKKRAEWSSVASFLRHYERVKESTYPHQYDSAELVALAAHYVRTADNVSVRDRLKLVVIDDAHEATESTFDFLSALSFRDIPIVASANPDVSSSAFRGGRADIATRFAEVTPLALNPLVLTRSYRQPAALREPYDRLVASIGLRGSVGQRKPRVSEPSRSALLQRFSAPSTSAEARMIAEFLRERHVFDDTVWSEMVVVTRTSRSAIDLERALARFGVPTRRNVSRLVLRDEAGARWLLDAASLAYLDDPFARPNDVYETARTAEAILAGPLGQLDSVSIRRLKLALRRHALSESQGVDSAVISVDALLCSAFAHPIEFEVLDDYLARRAARVAQALHAAREIAREQSVEDVLWKLWSASGIEKVWLEQCDHPGLAAQEAHRNLDAVVALQAAARRFVERRPQEDGSTFVHETLLAAVPEDSLAREREEASVLVTTPAHTIGQEYSYVVIAGVQEGVWPNLRPRNSLLRVDELLTADNEIVDLRAEVRSDEYRLFALAYSRARDGVVVSAVDDEDSRSSVLCELVPGDPVFFERAPVTLRDHVGSLRRRLLESVERQQIDTEAAVVLARLAIAHVPGADPDHWYGLKSPSTLQPLFGPEDRINVSPSRLETLQSSPFEWFLDQYAPSTSGSAQNVGIVVHAALEHAGDRSDVTPTELDAFVSDNWDRVRFDSPWQSAAVRRQASRMVVRVCDYLAQAHAEGRQFVAAESSFTLNLDHLTVRGRLDRIERTAAGALYIVDLKTGKALPTQKSMPQHLQLAVYQIAARKGEIEGLAAAPVAGAELLYVALPPAVRKQAPLSDEDIAQQLVHLEELAQKIRNQEFTEGPARRFGGRRYRIHFVPGVSQ